MWPFRTRTEQSETTLPVLKAVLYAVDKLCATENPDLDTQDVINAWQDLSNVLFVGVQHLQGSTAKYAQELKKRGATIVLSGKNYSTVLGDIGEFDDITLVAPHPYKFTESFSVNSKKNITSLVKVATAVFKLNPQLTRVVIVDDGAGFLKRFFSSDGRDQLITEFVAEIQKRGATIAGIEQTTRGLRKWVDGFAKSSDNAYVFPVVNFASALDKKVCEKKLIPESFINAFNEREISKTAPITVIGFGVIGQGIVTLLKQHGYVNVAVYDKYNRSYKGQNYTTLSEAVKNSRVVIGASGLDTFAQAIKEENLNLATLLSQLKYDVEFINAASETKDFAALKSFIRDNLHKLIWPVKYHEEDSLYDQVFTADDHTLTLVKGLHPLNFFLKNGKAAMPLQDSQLITGSLLACFYQALVLLDIPRKKGDLPAQTIREAYLYKLHSYFQRIIMEAFITGRSRGEFSSSELACFDTPHMIDDKSIYEYKKFSEVADGGETRTYYNQVLTLPKQFKGDWSRSLEYYGYFESTTKETGIRIAATMIQLLLSVPIFIHLYFRPSNYEKEIESLETARAKAVDLLEEGNDIAAQTTLEEALHNTKFFDDKTCLRTLIDLAQLYKRLNKITQGCDLNKATYCHAISSGKNKMQASSLLTNIGNCYFYEKQYEKTIVSYLAALNTQVFNPQMKKYFTSLITPLISALREAGQCAKAEEFTHRTLTECKNGLADKSGCSDMQRFFAATQNSDSKNITLAFDIERSRLIIRPCQPSENTLSEEWLDTLTAFNNFRDHVCPEVENSFPSFFSSEPTININWRERALNHFSLATGFECGINILYSALIAFLDDFLTWYHLPKIYKDFAIKAVSLGVIFCRGGNWLTFIGMWALNSILHLGDILHLPGINKSRIALLNNAILTGLILKNINDPVNLIPMALTLSSSIVSDYFTHKVIEHTPISMYKAPTP